MERLRAKGGMMDRSGSSVEIVRLDGLIKLHDLPSTQPFLFLASGMEYPYTVAAAAIVIVQCIAR